jgi:pilus assembly protein CpaE
MMAGPSGTAGSRRPTVAIALPHAESALVAETLRETGFEPVTVSENGHLVDASVPAGEVLLAVLDVGDEPAAAVAQVAAAAQRHSGHVLAVYIADADQLEALEAAGMRPIDDILLRPWTPDGLRWRLEALAIRENAPAASDGAPVVVTGRFDGDWSESAPVFVVFNPKGGVGKTTIATNLAAVLQLRKQREVLLLDADTVTGHVGLSLGISVKRSMADSWLDEAAGYPHESILDLATEHVSGIHVAALTNNPLTHPTLDPSLVTDAIQEARHRVDAVVVDLHPSYSDVNIAIFQTADRILLPVTPDLPAMRAAIQLKEVALELGVQDRLSLIINRANSGVTVSDIEETVGLPAFAQIRSAGMHLVWSANAGRTVIDKFPKHGVTQDFERLADRLLKVEGLAAEPTRQRDASAVLRSIFGRKALSEA